MMGSQYAPKTVETQMMDPTIHQQNWEDTKEGTQKFTSSLCANNSDIVNDPLN